MNLRTKPFKVGDLIRWTNPEGTATAVGLILNVTKERDFNGSFNTFCWTYRVLNIETYFKSDWREDVDDLKTSFTLEAEG
jgi:hypothetical protein